jgi:Tfp pilus assembly protein FimT
MPIGKGREIATNGRPLEIYRTYPKCYLKYNSKMYLVSPEYLNKNKRSSQSAALQQKLPLQNTAHKTCARVKRKKKGPKHPYEKWVAMRDDTQESAVGGRALIKAFADIMKVVLPDATLTQKVATPKTESVEFGTHCPESGKTSRTSLNLFCERICI